MDVLAGHAIVLIPTVLIEGFGHDIPISHVHLTRCVDNSSVVPAFQIMCSDSCQDLQSIQAEKSFH